MARFLIEVPPDPEARSCALAVQVLLQTGSHYLTNVEYGCFDGEHKGWLIVDADSRDEARHILPPVYRPQARIIRLNRFSMEEIDEILRQHPASPPARTGTAGG